MDGRVVGTVLRVWVVGKPWDKRTLTVREDGTGRVVYGKEWEAEPA